MSKFYAIPRRYPLEGSLITYSEQIINGDRGEAWGTFPRRSLFFLYWRSTQTDFSQPPRGRLTKSARPIWRVRRRRSAVTIACAAKQLEIVI